MKRATTIGIAVFFTVAVSFLVACQRNAAPELSIVFVGDTGLGDYPSKELAARHGYDYSFRHMRKTARRGDFLVGNLETPIATPDTPHIQFDKPIFVPRHEPEAAGALAREGFAALGLANNHMMDYGVSGLRQTLSYLRKAGVRSFGAGEDENAARAPLVLEKNGIRVAVLAYFQHHPAYRKRGEGGWFAAAAKPGVAALTEVNLREDIAAAKQRADFVTVLLHYRINYRPVQGVQRRFARRAVEAGVDLVIGHGPHIAQRFTTINGKPVLHSIGNYVWQNAGRYEKFDMDRRAYSLVTEATFTSAKLARLEITPFYSNHAVTKFVPQPATRAQARALFKDILSRLKSTWRWAGTTVVVDF
ncbi:MAG: CapA family protein [Candidatus Lernaella stagnicola]|nr:CapA family protein [Candidatus Lernaella stagnicola]